MNSKHIKLRVKNILNDLNIINAPIDPIRIAEHWGIKITYEPFGSEPLGHGISGCLLRDKEGNAIIGVNSLHHENRQRFTIAHELGHYLLHKGELTFIDRNFERINFRSGPSTKTSIEEIEANRFAAELLMPYDFLVNDILASKDIESGDFINEIATKYRVSRHALAIRLTSLNIN